MIKINIGDIVVVIGSVSVPHSLLGRYGVVTDASDYKVTVEFNKRVNDIGSFSHTSIINDLHKIGETNY